MVPKLLLAALVSAVAVYCTTAVPFTINTGTSTGTIAGPALLDAIVRFRRSASSPEESLLVALHRTNGGGLQFSIEDCPSGVKGCINSVSNISSIRTKRTIDFNIILSILRVILKLFGITIPDGVFNLLSGSTRNVTDASNRGTSSSSSSGALNLEALLG